MSIKPFTLLAGPALLGLALLGLAPAAEAQSQTWSFDETTTGNDVSWTSPTAVDPGAATYWVTQDITTIEVGTSFLGIPITVDVTDQVDPALLNASAPAEGPAPVTAVDVTFDVPGAPEPTSLAGTLNFGLDANGFGFLGLTDVVLGTADVDTGIFGIQTVNISSVRFAGTLTVNATWFDLDNALAGTNGLPVLTGDGQLAGGDDITLTTSNALPGATAFFVVGVFVLGLPFEGGILVPNPDPPGFFVALPVDGLGQLQVGGTWPAGIPGGISLYYQTWILDPGAIFGNAASNAVRSITP